MTKKMTTIITREMKEKFIERIITNSSFWLNEQTSSVKVLTEMMRIQNFIVRNVNYHASFNRIDFYTCYDDAAIDNLCIALKKLITAIETNEETKVFENIRGYTFGDLETDHGVIQVYQKDKIVYAKTIQSLTPGEKDKLIASIKFNLWIIGNWRQNNHI